MQQINVVGNDMMVSVRISIVFDGPIRYTYRMSASRDITFRDHEPGAAPFPHILKIARGKDLQVHSNNINSWRIEFGGEAGHEHAYDVKIEWFQHPRVEPIGEWHATGKTHAGKASTVISGNCNYRVALRL
jgi:hypothetical protein